MLSRRFPSFWTRSLRTRSSASPLRYSTKTSELFTGMSEEGLSESQIDVRRAIQRVCSNFDDDYWLAKEQKQEYPNEFYHSIRDGRWLGIATPTSYGGAGLGISEAVVMLQTIAESGASIAGAQAIHCNIYPLMPILEFGNETQKRGWLPQILDGRIRCCFGVTEPSAGSETLKLRTKAVKSSSNGKYIVNGSKIWTSSAQVATHCVLLLRTSERQPDQPRWFGLSLFLAPLRDTKGVNMRKIAKMGGNAIDANEVFFDDYELDPSMLIGNEGEGFKYVLHGMNAERCLLAGEALGTGYAALRRGVKYASERVVFGKPIGANQGVQHPLASAWAHLEAARHLTYAAASLYDRQAPPKEVGTQANAAKYMAAEAGYKACETALMVHGGMGYAKEYHVERYLREVMVPRLAPVSREMILNYLGQQALGLPKSY